MSQSLKRKSMKLVPEDIKRDEVPSSVQSVAHPAAEEIQTAEVMEAENEQKRQSPLKYKNVKIADIQKKFLNSKPDFRALKEPQRTEARLSYVLTNTELPMNMTQRGVAAVLIHHMRGKEGKELVILQDIYPGKLVSPGARKVAFNILEKLGLIRKITLRKAGSEIELLF